MLPKHPLFLGNMVQGQNMIQQRPWALLPDFLPRNSLLCSAHTTYTASRGPVNATQLGQQSYSDGDLTGLQLLKGTTRQGGRGGMQAAPWAGWRPEALGRP